MNQRLYDASYVTRRGQKRKNAGEKRKFGRQEGSHQRKRWPIGRRGCAIYLTMPILLQCDEGKIEHDQ